MQTERVTTALETAARFLQAGELVAVPTETVYGLAGNGLDEQAVQRIYEVKGRPAVKPLSLMVPGAEAMDAYCEDVPAQARALAEKFWPGPLTIVLKARPLVPSLVRAGGATVGLRCPDHPLTLELLRLAGIPFAAPSANPSGEPSPKTAGEVLGYFDGKIAAVVDGGACGIGRESTLLDMSATPYRVLRQGALSREAIENALVEQLTILGVTGPTGSGKTTVLREVENAGGLAIDCDAVYHELLDTDAELISELDAAFPGTVREGALDRKALAALVFGDAEKLQTLNAITHRRVVREVERRLRDFAMAGGTLAAIDAIALLESGLSARCDATVAVIAPVESRLTRIMDRDNLDIVSARRRIEAQPEDAYYIKRCDRVLRNDADRPALIAKTQELLKELQRT